MIKQSDAKKAFLGDISGEVMLESTLVMMLVLFLLIGLISLGFLFYQRSMLNTLAVDTANEIAANYKYSAYKENSNGELEVRLYRTTFAKSKVEALNKTKAEKYIQTKAAATTLGTDTKVVLEDFNVVTDSIGRMHVEVSASMEFDFLFSGALKYFGIISGKPKIVSTARSECLDITAYAGHVNFLRYVQSKANESEFLNTAAGIIDDIKSVVDAFK